MLVTGGAGFVGRRLCAHLAAHGAVVTATTARAATQVAPVEGAALRQVALHDAVAVAALLDTVAPDVVVHLASAVTGTRALDAVAPTFELNLASTVVLLEALARHAPTTRFVHAGSLEEPPPGNPVAPSSPYAAAKAAASAYVRMFHSLYELPTCIARLFMIYGPGEQNTDRLVPYVIRTLLAGEAPALSSGTRPVDWVHVDDVVDGLVRLAAACGPDGPAAGRTVDLGTGTLTTVREVAERIAALVDGPATPAFGTAGDRPHEQVRVADVAATRAVLGWAPGITLDAGLASTIDWFRAH